MKKILALLMALLLLAAPQTCAAEEAEPAGRYEIVSCVIDGQDTDPAEAGMAASYLYITGVDNGSVSAVVIDRDGAVEAVKGPLERGENGYAFHVIARTGELFAETAPLFAAAPDAFPLVYDAAADEIELVLSEDLTCRFARPAYDPAVAEAMDSLAEVIILFSQNEDLGGAVLSDRLDGDGYTLSLSLPEGVTLAVSGAGDMDPMEAVALFQPLMKEAFAACGEIALNIEVRSEGEVVAVMAKEQEVEDIQTRIQTQLADNRVVSDKDVMNVLLVGTDARSVNERARSDVMMLVSLNRESRKIVLTSFMRDIYTYIPDYGFNRLNAPYAMFGPESLIETLEADFGLEIEGYAAVNFYAFADAVDAMEGIDLELTRSEVNFINEQAYYGEQAQMGVGTGQIYLEYSEDGWYHLNGTQTLAHCRKRSSIGSDFDRTSRQRAVISALMEKAKTLSLKELYALADTILPMISTDLTQRQCLSLLVKSGKYLTYDVESLHIPEDEEYTSAMIDGMAVLVVDFAAASQRIQEVIYGE